MNTEKIKLKNIEASNRRKIGALLIIGILLVSLNSFVCVVSSAGCSPPEPTLTAPNSSIKGSGNRGRISGSVTLEVNENNDYVFEDVVWSHQVSNQPECAHVSFDGPTASVSWFFPKSLIDNMSVAPISLSVTFSATVTYKHYQNGSTDPWDNYYSVDAGSATISFTIDLHGNNTNTTICFLEDTKILMGSSSAENTGSVSVKNIQDVKKGDTVKAFNRMTGEIESAEVVDLEVHTPEEMIEGYIELGIDNRAIIKVTPNHPLLVNEIDYIQGKAGDMFDDGSNYAYIRAGDLKVGDKLFDREITSINKYPKAREYSYNILLDNEYLNYIVIDEDESFLNPNQDGQSEINSHESLFGMVVWDGGMVKLSPILLPSIFKNNCLPIINVSPTTASETDLFTEPSYNSKIEGSDSKTSIKI